LAEGLGTEVFHWGSRMLIWGEASESQTQVDLADSYRLRYE